MVSTQANGVRPIASSSAAWKEIATKLYSETFAMYSMDLFVQKPPHIRDRDACLLRPLQPRSFRARRNLRSGKQHD